MNVLITGCAGFIGSHAVDHFLSNGARVIGVDSLTYAGNTDNLKDAYESKNFTFVYADICNTDKIKKCCNDYKIQWIVNFAAETHVDNSIDCEKNFIHSNIVGVSSLLQVCKALKIPLLHISTDEVYGSALDNVSYEEVDQLCPSNPYSATKAAAEHLIRSYHNTHKTNYIIVRPSNNFGPRQHREKFLPTIIKSLKNNKKIPVYGDGKNIRDWLYVKDNVKMIYNILVKSKLNETYNISCSKEMKNLQIIKYVTEIMSADFKNSIEFVEDRPGHDYRYSIKNSKVKSIGAYHESGFLDSLKDTIESYGKHV